MDVFKVFRGEKKYFKEIKTAVTIKKILRMRMNLRKREKTGRTDENNKNKTG